MQVSPVVAVHNGSDANSHNSTIVAGRMGIPQHGIEGLVRWRSRRRAACMGLEICYLLCLIVTKAVYDVLFEAQDQRFEVRPQ